MKPDIEVRILADFHGSEREEARGILELVDAELGGGEHPRISRCILFLANGDMNRLVHYADRALLDPRDVMAWSEYDEHDQRLRDFNQPFAGS